jgi:opacity protein-like surface antigen
VSVDVTQNLKADLTWRYVNSGTLSSLANASGGVAKSALTSQQLRLGFRYMID